MELNHNYQIMASQKNGTLLRWHIKIHIPLLLLQNKFFHAVNTDLLFNKKKKHCKLCIGYDWLVVNAFIAKCKAPAKSVKR